MKLFQIADKKEGECPYKGYFISFFRCFQNTPPVRNGWQIVINPPFTIKKFYTDHMDFEQKYGPCRPIIVIGSRTILGHKYPSLYNWSLWAPQQ